MGDVFDDAEKQQDVFDQAAKSDPLKTGEGMLTPKAPAPRLPSSAGGESPISSMHAQDAEGLKAAQKEYPAVTSPKTIAATAGGILGGGLAGPAAGLVTRSLATGAGMGLGNSVGQAASGENPVSPESLQESGGRALMGAGAEFGAGALGKAANIVGDNPGLIRGTARDLTDKYVSRRLADAILPDAERIAALKRAEALRAGTTAPGAWKPGRGPSGGYLPGSAEAPVETLKKPSGRLVLDPDEARVEEARQALEARLARANGMHYAARIPKR